MSTPVTMHLLEHFPKDGWINGRTVFDCACGQTFDTREAWAEHVEAERGDAKALKDGRDG